MIRSNKDIAYVRKFQSISHTEILERWDKFLKKLRITLLPYQQELAEQLLLFPENAKITQCRQSGKSFDFGLLCVFLMVVLRLNIVLTAPIVTQTRQIMKYVLRAQDRFKFKYHWKNKYSLSLVNRGSIECLSGSDTANVEGPSADILIVEEHQDMTMEHVADVFLPMLSWTEGLLWTCGIAGADGTVAERNDVDFEWKLPWQEVVKVKPGYQKIVDMARKESLPPEFKSNYECKKLDMSAHRLITKLEAIEDTEYEYAKTVVGIDWGKRIDQSVCTVVDKVGTDNVYMTGWLVPTGSYDQQITQMVKWLRDDIDYDEIISETNGVGDGCTDVLIKEMGDDGVNVTGLYVDDKWLSEMAKLVHRKAASGELRYNESHPVAGACVKDLKMVDYKMLDTDLVKCTHSDFLSSLFCALDEPGEVYL